MSEAPQTDDGSLPLTVAERVDQACDRFEAAWRAGQPLRLEDHLADVPEADRPALLRELVALEIDYRQRRGEEPRPEDYQSRFPELDPAWLAEAFAAPAESTGPFAPARQRAGRTGPPGDTPVQRLRCPHCHNPIQLGDDQSDEVLCPGCGSLFRVRDARQTDTVSASRPLGKFWLLERVGLGAFGAVWKAKDTELDRIVALKIPHAGLLTEAEELERFQREARATAQLRHPGIVTVHEVATLNGLPTIVADFVAGVTLRDLLEVRPLTFREAAALVAEVADAVDYAHQMGVVHRDLKPANIMVEYEGGVSPRDATRGLGRPLVMDFGLALRDEAEVTLTVDGQVLGTPAYMSPEQARGHGHKVDGRGDVYSLGVILYELLTGELPFRGSRHMMLLQVLHDEPKPPRRLNDQVPRDLETVCLKCLEKEPQRCYAAAAELAADLRRFLAGEPVVARPVGWLARAWRWCRRNPMPAVLILVMSIGIVGISWQWFAAIRARRQVEQLSGRVIELEKALQETQNSDEKEAIRQELQRVLGAPLDFADQRW